jgi:hypothetical protein
VDLLPSHIAHQLPLTKAIIATTPHNYIHHHYYYYTIPTLQTLEVLLLRHLAYKVISGLQEFGPSPS